MMGEKLLRAGGMLATPLTSPILKTFMTGSEATLAERLKTLLKGGLSGMPWKAVITDWTGDTYELGGTETHWGGETFRVHIKTVAAGRDLLALDGLRFLERFLQNEVDMSGIYVMHDISTSFCARRGGQGRHHQPCTWRHEPPGLHSHGRLLPF